VHNGVRVESPCSDFHAHPEATADIRAVGDADMRIHWLKLHSLPEIAPVSDHRWGGKAL
jgi:hypothetical protein